MNDISAMYYVYFVYMLASMFANLLAFFISGMKYILIIDITFLMEE